MKHNEHHQHLPSLEGDVPSEPTTPFAVDHAEAAVPRNVPSYMPRTLKALLNWLDTFIGEARGATTEFPNVFNASGIYNIHRVVSLRESIAAGLTAREAVVAYQRALTGWINKQLHGSSDVPPVPAPRPSPALTVPTTVVAQINGLVSVVDSMVQLLRKQPNFVPAVHGKRFGLLPETTPPVDPATLDPQPSAAFTGGQVVVSLRSPQRTPGVSMAEIYVDRNDGAGTHKIATTIFSRFTDHAELPAERTLWAYYVNFLDRNGVPVGVQSTATVVVQAMPTKGGNND